MISSRQIKNIVDYMFSGGISGSGFINPTSTFLATTYSYTESTVPGSITLSGTIIPNDGTLTNWTITDGSSTLLASGSGTSISHNLISIPSTASSNNYYLTVYYVDNNGNNLSFLKSLSIVVSVDALYGQLALPSDNITIPADLTPGIEAILTVGNQNILMNIFNITAVNTGRIIFVIPDSYGAISAIEDGASLDVTAQFNEVIDAPNSRKIYTSLNTVTPATYSYKIIF